MLLLFLSSLLVVEVLKWSLLLKQGRLNHGRYVFQLQKVAKRADTLHVTDRRPLDVGAKDGALVQGTVQCML